MMDTATFREIQSHQDLRRISMPCISLCFLIVVILGFLPIVPDIIVKILKPAFLVLCVFSIGQGYYRFGFEKWLITLHFYLFGIWLINMDVEPSISAYASMLLFALFYLFAGLRIWNKAEIRLIFHAIILACTIYAAIVIFSNNDLLRSSGEQHVSFLSQELNRNSCAFAVTPGAIAALLMIFYGKRGSGIRAFYLFAFLLCFYTVIILSCRSAFLSVVAGSFLIVWQAAREHADKNVRSFRRVVFLFLFIALLFFGMRYLEGTNSSRLFDYSNDSGRDELWSEAWRLIRAKPLFGGGFGYWERNGNLMSPHNTFLNIMLISGYVGGVLLGIMMLFMLLECLWARNLVALAFAMEMIFHSISEAGLDYYAYLPLMLTTILLRYTEYQNRNIFSIFREAASS